DFWYNMHDWGLREYAYQTSRRVLQEVTPAHAELERNLRNAHKNVTGLIDDFYTNKANLTSILYNMIDNYIGWRQSIEMDLNETGSGEILMIDNPIAYNFEMQPGSMPGAFTAATGYYLPDRSSQEEETDAPLDYPRRLQ